MFLTKANFAFFDSFPKDFFIKQQRLLGISSQFQNLIEPQALRRINDLTSALQSAYPQYLNSSWDTYMKNYKKITSAWIPADNKAFTSYWSNMQALNSTNWDKLFSPQINGIVSNINWEAIRAASSILTHNRSLIDNSILTRILTESEIEEATQELSPEDTQAMADDVNEIFSDPQNWEQKLQIKAIAWQQKHPVLAFVFISIILPFIISCFSPCNPAKAVKSAPVYEEPTSSSKIIVRVTPEQEIIVIGDAPYYFEIETSDLKNGKKYVGYIYKAVVKFVEETDAE